MMKSMTIALGLSLAGVSTLALAQPKKSANPFQGFSSDNSQPVNINSEQLEFQQNQKKAIYSGNVVAIQS